MSKDALRKATLGQALNFKKEIVKYNGVEFEIRQPSIKVRSDLRKKCSLIEDGAMNFDMFEFLILLVMECTFVPSTNEKVFEKTDYEILVAMPTGSFMDVFGDVASKFVNIDTNEKKNR